MHYAECLKCKSARITMVVIYRDMYITLTLGAKLDLFLTSHSSSFTENNITFQYKKSEWKKVTSVHVPRWTGPALRPSSSNTSPSTGTYAMKWKASPFSLSDGSCSWMIGVADLKLLWACRTTSWSPSTWPVSKSSQPQTSNEKPAFCAALDGFVSRLQAYAYLSSQS